MTAAPAFDQLVATAAAQSQPQSLLFVFAGAEWPADATPAQRARVAAGARGRLRPLMCVEKRLDEVSTFDALVEESREVGPPWQVVFAAGLSGQEGRLPAPKATTEALNTMVEGVRSGAVDAFLALSDQGERLTFM